MRWLRYCFRVPLLLWHLAIDLPVALLWMLGGDEAKQRAMRWWSAGLLRIFGFRLRRRGLPLDGAVMFVANHVSWVDIVALHSQHMMGFIAKSEIRRWPLIGWLAAQGESIFLQRGNGDSLGRVVVEMAQRLRAGRAVAAFPEGGTRNGRALCTFHARIFAAAVEAAAPVQPVAIGYGPRASAQTRIAFAPRERFVGNFIRLLGEPAREVHVRFLDPIPPHTHDGRRSIAATAQEQVARALEAG